MLNPYQQALMNYPTGDSELERFRRAQQNAQMMAAKQLATSVPAPPVQPATPVNDPAMNAWDMSPLANQAAYVPQPTAGQRLSDMEVQRNLERYAREDAARRGPAPGPSHRDRLPRLTPHQEALVRPARQPYPAVSDFAETNPPAPPSPPPAVAAVPAQPAQGAGGPVPFQPQLEYPAATLDKGPSTKANMQATRPNNMDAGQQRGYEGGQPVQKPLGDPQDIVPAAIDNVQRDPSFLDKARGWMDQLGSYFDPAGQGGDPNALHPAYGVPNAQVWEAQRGVLFNAGIMLMAAGMPNSPENRAAIIASMGNALNQTADQVIKVASASTGAYGKDATSVKEYEFARRNGYTGSYDQFVKMRYGTDYNDKLQFEERKLWLDKEGGYKEGGRARDTIMNAEKMLGLVEDGIFTGSLADNRAAAANLLSTFGLGGDELARAVSNDKLFRGYVMELILPRMQELGGNDSNEELAQLKGMIADPSMPIDAIKRKLMDIIETQKMRYERLRTQGDALMAPDSPYRLKPLAMQPARVPELPQSQPAAPVPGGGAPAAAPARPRILSVE